MTRDARIELEARRETILPAHSPRSTPWLRPSCKQTYTLGKKRDPEIEKSLITMPHEYMDEDGMKRGEREKER